MINKNKLYRYDISQSALYKCHSKSKLSEFLKINIKDINKIIKYYTFNLPKKNSSKFRQISAPQKDLKILQKRLLYLIKRIKRPSWLFSGEMGKCYLDNGKYHLKNSYVLTIDIKSFYENCTRNAVYLFFLKKMQTSPDVAKILTDITTLEKNFLLVLQLANL